MKVEMHGTGRPPICLAARVTPARRRPLRPISTLRKDGASIGTITFAAAASTATFAFTSEIAFAAGARLTVLAPDSQDASLAEISITFKGTRS